MMELRSAAQRGIANLGWLHSQHSFSFGSYYDPQHQGFSDLLVINEDRVQPGRGFDPHGHRDMEIFSYVLDGAEQQRFVLPENRFAYVHVARGALHINGQRLVAGDAVKLRQVREVEFSQGEQAEVLLFDLRPNETPRY